MNKQLTKPLIVPEYLNALVKLYIADANTGATIQREPYTINLQDVLTRLIRDRTARPNSCALNGKDLFISNSSENSQCIFKLPNYIDQPAQAIAEAFIFTLQGGDYVGIAFDPAGNLYAAEGNAFGDNQLVKYTGTDKPFQDVVDPADDNFATRVEIGNAGVQSYFANLAFDAAGNLWVSDYKNHRIIVFNAANLGGSNTFHVLNNLKGAIPVANTNAGLGTNTSHLFAEPEGVDFDEGWNLWVANNNDGTFGAQTRRTSLVKLTPAIQVALLNTAAGEHLTPTVQQSNKDFFIYQVPNLSDDRGATPRFGGLQIDRAAGRIFVNEQQAKRGRWYDIATIEAAGTSTATNDLDVVSTIPGNGGIALVNAQFPMPNSVNSITNAAGGIRTDPEGSAPAGNVNLITWKDSRNADRTLILGAYLYQYDFSFDDNREVVTRMANDRTFGHPGFGYVVSHNTQNGNSPLGKANASSKVETTVFSGGHHAIHRVELIYDRDKENGGFGIQIPVVIEWFVATGRDHPVWAVTWKMGEAANPQNVDFDVYRMDVRGPYGSLNFDGAADRNHGDAIGGVAWGDFALKFTTTGDQLTLNSPWTYNNPNTVCFTQAWAANVNAEMGIVQTRIADKEMGYQERVLRRDQDRVVARERGHSSSEDYQDKANCKVFGSDNRNYVLPCVTGWPYQLMNFDWDPGSGKPATEATSTKLIAWGSPYGWLGASSFNLFDFSATADGRGDRSYATFIVLGPKFRFGEGNNHVGDVESVIDAVEALNAATISDVNPGSLVTQVAKGPGAIQLKNTPNGYNDSYAAYYLNANDNKVAFTFTPAAGTVVRSPIFVVQNYTAQQPPRIAVDDNPITVNTGADAGAFVSLNLASNELWATLNASINTATNVKINV
jgi:hypothetical protein